VNADSADTLITPEGFVEPGRRLFLDTNIFMETDEGRRGGLRKLFERCNDTARRNGNGIVVPTKVIDELTKQSLKDTTGLDEDRRAAVEQAGKWLEMLRTLAAGGLVRTDLGDHTNPYADDLFVEVFTRFGGQYDMCLLTNDITLSMRIRLLALAADRQLVAGTVSEDGRVAVESEQSLHDRAARKLERATRRISEGTDTEKDHYEVSALTPLLEQFRQTFGVVLRAERAPRAPRAATPSFWPAEVAFSATAELRETDQVLGGAKAPGVGEQVNAESGQGIRTLVLGEALGEGGEGKVFAVQGDDAHVVKIFHEDHRTRHRSEKVRLLVSRELASPGICFPTSFVTNGSGEFVGYAMPRASGQELQATIMRPARFKKTYPDWRKADLVDVCVSFLERVARLHSLNILLGDINPKNVMVTEHKEVWIIDADSWQLDGYPCPVGTPMFSAPTITGEYAEQLRTMEEELFAVATMLFMILITGQFPYSRKGADSGDPATLIKQGLFAFQFKEYSNRDQPDGNWKYMWSHLPIRVKREFWNTFHRDGNRYNHRPTVVEWLEVFREYQQFFGGLDDFDPMSNDVYPTRFRAKDRNAHISECARCGTSMVAEWRADRYVERELCKECHENLPRCAVCGKPKAPDSLLSGRCWACRQRDEERDEELDPAQLCRDCGEPFITFKHAGWFTGKGLKIPRSHETINRHCPPKALTHEQQRPTERRQQPEAKPAAAPQARSARPATNAASSLWTRIRARLNL
jgi:hypothetical protein